MTLLLTQRNTLPQRLLYLTEEGQYTYSTLCEDQEYLYYHETLQYVVDNCHHLVETILRHCGVTEVDFISLGTGNGRRDAVLLKELLRHAGDARYTYYYSYDVSSGLLLESIRTILARELPLEKLRVTAIEADIAYLAEFKKVFDFREEPKIYSLLGDSDLTGNEVRLLTSLHELMGPQDCLLLETRKKAGSGPQALGNVELNRRLDLAPLRYIGARVDPTTVQYTEVPSTSTVANTRTIAARVPILELEGKRYRDTTLFSVPYYDDQDLRNVFDDIGFQVLKGDNKQNNSLFYLLGKSA